jgi:hypothetical protein
MRLLLLLWFLFSVGERLNRDAMVGQLQPLARALKTSAFRWTRLLSGH